MKMLALIRNKISPVCLKILQELGNCFKKKSGKNAPADFDSIGREDVFYYLKSNQLLRLSDLFMYKNSNSPSNSYQLEKKIALEVFQTSIKAKDLNLKPLSFGEIINSSCSHIFYYLHPGFLQQRSLIFWNYEGARKKDLKWVLNDGYIIINVDMAIKAFNSLEFIINKGLTNFSIPIEEKQSKKKKNMKNLTNQKLVSSNTGIKPDKSQLKISPIIWNEKKINFLAKLLNMEKNDVRNQIMKHPKKNFVSLEQLKETYNFLLKNNYSQVLIKDCITILFYPKEKVEQTLKYLHTSNVIETEEDKKYVLQLCVYYMEKPVHFTGLGVFPSENLENS